MATKPTSGGGRSKGSSASSRSAAKRPSGSRSKSAASTRSTASRASSGSARKPAARKPAASRNRAAQTAQRSVPAGQNGSSSNGFAGAAKGAVLAVGATALGVAGAIVLKGRQQRKTTVLGVSVPRNLSMPDVDVKELVKTVGKASRQLGETSKSVSKDIERVGEQAERIGKLLS